MWRTCASQISSCLQGEVLDVAVDLRPESPTYGQYETVLLSGWKSNPVFVPRGFAHGFWVSETATFFYKCDNFTKKAKEFIFNDETVNINWIFLWMNW